MDLAEALDAATVELAQLAETPIPLPERLLDGLEERDALAATLKRIVPASSRDAVAGIYREERAKAHRTEEGHPAAVLPEVLRQIEAVSETLRRRATLEPELRRALRGALLRSDFAGC